MDELKRYKPLLLDRVNEICAFLVPYAISIAQKENEAISNSVDTNPNTLN